MAETFKLPASSYEEVLNNDFMQKNRFTILW